ncbi:MAG: hypothetical protein CMM50_06180 [Rhodospirillaceae bacterium]|nr:hypothetical protein [Rhodospirillaceae bacterium]
MPNATPTIADKVTFLSRPESYPLGALRVEVRETHMSWVFLTGDRVYKLKKPVRYDYLDFSTLTARYRDSMDEVRLNRRLAGDVYIGLVPLSRHADGSLILSAGAHEVDWLVEMRRLPADRMLDRLIAAGRVEDADLDRLGEVLARFFAGAERVALSGDAYRARLGAEIDGNRSELTDPAFGLPRDLVERVTDRQRAVLATDAGLFDARATAGRIVEGHGDLRPEHVALLDTPVVIDCIEFNRDFRILDPADEIAFLAMDSDRLGAPAVGPRVLAAYARMSGDAPPDGLFAFYRSHRATVRAKIAIWHNREPDTADPAKWHRRALDYLRLAERDLQG